MGDIAVEDIVSLLDAAADDIEDSFPFEDIAVGDIA